MKKSLLIVEDEARFRETLTKEFRERGYAVVESESVAKHAGFGTLSFDFAIVDLRLGEKSGLDEIPEILSKNPKCRILMLTGFGSIATAVRAVKLGATNYLTKPASVQDIELALWMDSQEGMPPSIEALEIGESLARHEREYIEFVMQQCEGNVSRAARWLGIHRQSLQRKLRKFTPK